MPISTCPVCGGNVDDRPCPRCSAGLEPTRHDQTTAPCHDSTVAATRPPSTEPMTGGRTSEDLSTRQFSVLETIGTRIGTVPHVLLRDTVPGEQPSPLTRPTPNEADATLRYRIDGEIARGGMGAVLKGHDPDLGRDVAIKVLRDDMRDNADLLRRFVEEAQIGGQLQHPGVVPIHELGAFADGRPFFAMRLVKGRTLADLLAARSGPADDLPRFLTIFAAVAQTMAYAHTRGVIHRDLKPSNIMVGSFGEVQVMDWGLAKVLPRGGVGDDARAGRETESETLIATARSGSDADLSVAGSVLGTPSYMPPEQAKGEIDRIDERADVFSLGSILAEILTGKPAITGRGVREILLKAALGETTEARSRLADSGAESELVAIVSACLEREPGDRPRDATVVADRITGYQAGVQERFQAAIRDRAVAEARAVGERKQRRLQLGLAASVLAITTMGGLGLLVEQGRKSARAATVARLVGEVITFRNQARATPEDPARWRTALAAVTQAEQGAGDEPESRAQLAALKVEIQDGASAAERDRVLLDKLADIRSAKADDPEGTLSEAMYGDAFRTAGLDLTNLLPAKAGESIRARPPGVAAAMVAALDDWSSIRRSHLRDPDGAGRLSEVARESDPDPWRNSLRSALVLTDEARLAALRSLANSAGTAELGAVSLDLMGKALDSSGDAELAERVLSRAQIDYPKDVWVNFDLAEILRKRHQLDEAIRFYTVARSLRPETAHELAHELDRRGDHEQAIAIFHDLIRLRPTNGRNFECLGVMLSKRGRSAEAAVVLSNAEAIERETIRRRPADFSARSRLGFVLRERGDLDEAAAAYREAIRIGPGDSGSYDSLGSILKQQDKLDEAVAAYREGIRINPKDARIRWNLGDTLKQQDKLDEAVAAYREAIRLGPNDAGPHNNLGNILSRQNKHDEAADAYREAIRLLPNNAGIHKNLGDTLTQLDKHEEAITAYREAIRIDPSFVDALNNLGNILSRQDKLDEAIASFREAIRIDPDRSKSHRYLGDSLGRQNRFVEAIAEYRQAIRIDPNYGEAYNNMGTILVHQNKLDEAIPAFREAIRIGTKDNSPHSNLGSILVRQNKLDEAIPAFREAIRIGPNDAAIQRTLGDILSQQNKYDEAVAAYREAVRIDRKNDYLHYLLGNALASQGELSEAIAVYREAIRINPNGYGAHNELGYALERLGRPEEAADEYREVIRIQPNSGRAQYGLGCTLERLGKTEEAITSYRGAVRINPKDSRSLTNLGSLLARRGDFAEALDVGRKAQILENAKGKPNPDLDQWLPRIERAAVLVGRLPAILSGSERPASSAELLEFAQVCILMQDHTAAARLYAEALDGDAKLGDDLLTGRRYNAACSAALAGTGQGRDNPPPDAARKAELRSRALGWLRSDLASWTGVLEEGPEPLRAELVRMVRHWKEDADLAAVRDSEKLARIPEAERDGWRTLWADVDALLNRAQAGKP